jgi:DNA repair photolyase
LSNNVDNWIKSTIRKINSMVVNQPTDTNLEKGRGAQFNPQNRFLKGAYVHEFAEAIDDWETGKTTTKYIIDANKTVVNKVVSPDVGMMFSLNPYQGCEHGCIYCYARNTHEYWGYSAGVDFESNIVVKKNAPALLRKWFEGKNRVASVISLSGNTDCYQPVERKMRLTRTLLEICLEYRNPVSIITKNTLILRDLDILKELNKLNLVRVATSITSVDESLRRILEPRTSTYASRLNIVATLAKHKIPVGIMNAPIIPAINDIHMYDTLKAAAEAGASWAGYTIVRLNGAVAPVFKDWLYKAMPDRANKVWSHIADCHGGTVNDSRFGNRMVGEGKYAETVKNQFETFCRKLRINESEKTLEMGLFRNPNKKQLDLFGS